MREAHSIVAARVGARLKAIRGRETQVEFARRLGLSQAQYNRYETGKRLAPDRILELVAEVAGIAAEEVVWGEAPDYVANSPEPAREIASLLAMLDEEDREDFYIFLKNKTAVLARKKESEARRANAVVKRLSELFTGRARAV